MMRRFALQAVVIGRIATAIALTTVARPAAAQLDPLIALKRMPPNVVVVFDTSRPMLADVNGDVYDLKTYHAIDNPAVAAALGVPAGDYRRIYRGLTFAPPNSDGVKYDATAVAAVPSTASAYGAFWAPTRLEIAKAGLLQAVTENPNLVRWSLLKLRQNAAAWPDLQTGAGCDGPVRVTSAGDLDALADPACASGAALSENAYTLFGPTAGGPSGAIANGPGDAVLVGAGSPGATAAVLADLRQPIGTGSLIPAGVDSSAFIDRPLYNGLVDAAAQVSAAIAEDDPAVRACRNTVVVLITSGADDGSAAYLTHDRTSVLAASFARTPAGSTVRRVPIVVIGVGPRAEDDASLEDIATASGGRYVRATTAADVTMAVDAAVQWGFARPADVDASRESEFTSVSPVVGTVDLIGGVDATGAPLANTIVSGTGAVDGQTLPQRDDVLLTAGFGLPGFDGRVRAFRTFVPTPDVTSATGWTFTKDGTRLWPDLDDRPTLAGLARAPASPDARNIYTFIPDGAGGGRMMAFVPANAAVLSPYFGGADPAVLIPFVRAQSIGAVIDSTPAIMSPPSASPSPDADYGTPDLPGTFAGDHRDRRAIIFFGANDGMLHAVDARTGYEVWAFIPFNLLPKLRTLVDGQPVEQFDYFVDSSPKIADVKIAGAWRTLLVVGEGYGGTFYQAFDVTDAGMGVDPAAANLAAVNALLTTFADAGQRIRWTWAFPSYSSFDPTFASTSDALGSAFPGGRLTLFGDLKATASNAEKRVGFTFSDPAVVVLAPDRSVTAVVMGSGYFPDVESGLAGRGASAPRAGHALFVIDVATGALLGDPGGACAGVGCLDVGDAANGRKNALQADVSAVLDVSASGGAHAYAGDVDGTLWRFALTSSGSISADSELDAGQPIYGSSAVLIVGAERDVFFATGSDLLPNAAPGGGSAGADVGFHLYGVRDGASNGVMFSVALTPVTSAASSTPTNGERPAGTPVIAGDIVFFETTSDEAAASCADQVTRVYAFTYVGTTGYDTNGNGRLDSGDSPVVAVMSGHGTAPFAADRHLYIGVTSVEGAGVAVLGKPDDFNTGAGQTGIRVLSWKPLQ